ncbi:MAG: response regulator transcription factor [Chloroflexi bacterium]|nr:response regulator transcription factor [Chloroflexota bacterium]
MCAYESDDLVNGSGGAGQKVRVMLVDNDKAFLQIAKTLLQTRMPEETDIVGTASTGEDCLVQAQLLAPEVVLMDLQMPGMGGLRTIPLLRVLFPDTRVIALTFDDRERTRQAVLAAGGSDLISKGTLRADLIPAVRRVIGEEQPPARAVAA